KVNKKVSPLFLKGREGRGERGKTSFLVKRSFQAFPASSPHIGNKAFEKKRDILLFSHPTGRQQMTAWQF
ncbi:MAG: hypothetical protein IJC21_03345, partial [Lentisphaeria bacterium]|nr:hypothetical protein [Lentisphaeria bacterium]